MSKDGLFALFASGEDVSQLFRSLLYEERDNLFTSINISSLTEKFTGVPIDPQRDDAPSNTLFGGFSNNNQPPPSPTSSIMSLPEEVTQHTIPDDDLWQQADVQSPPEKKLYTWESFGAGRRAAFLLRNPYVTEQSPKAFDELLQRHMNNIYSPDESGIVVDDYLFSDVSSLRLLTGLTTVSPFCLCRPRILVIPVECETRICARCAKIAHHRNISNGCPIVTSTH